MCGIFGIFEHLESARLTKEGLFALQHRGQESAGIATYDGECGRIIHKKGMGLVNDVFVGEILEKLKGDIAIGHTRYSTRGAGNLLENAQPHSMVDTSGISFALASNGDILHTRELREELARKGVKFYSENDGELLVKMIAYYFKEEESKRPYLPRVYLIGEAIKHVMKKVKGAYSALMITNQGEMFIFRDPLGFRPLVMGEMLVKDERYGHGQVLVFASETCALDLVRARFLREIEPGEILVLSREIHRFFYSPKRWAQCIFELIYFSRPDSITFSESVSQIRRALGRKLAIEHPVKVDIVIPVPDSSNSTALGYSEESGVPLGFGLVRSHYVGRTFIEPAQTIRDFHVRLKFNPDRAEIKGKRIVMVDDSIVRASTSRKLVRMVQAIHDLRGVGAKEVHIRISCPPITHSCYFGIDTPTREELIASLKTIEEIKEHIEADSLGYLSLEGLRSVVRNPRDFCYACFTGRYPIK